MKQRFGRIAWAIYLFLWGWSVPLLAFDLVPPGGEFMASVMLILPGALCGWWLIQRYQRAGWWSTLIILLGSWLTEHLGVTTGIPFGAYTYNQVLLPTIGGVVPLAIPFAWLLVIPAALEIARLISKQGWIVLVLAATTAMLFDLVIEPAAVYLYHYWTWLETGGLFGIPTSNFVAWWGLAFILASITLVLINRADQHNHRATHLSLPMAIYGLNIMLFSLVNLTHSFYLAGLLGLILLALLIALIKRRKLAWSIRYDVLI